MAAADTSRSGGGHPLLGLALLQPQLLVDHASACAELFVAEGEIALQRWRRVGLWSVLALAGLVLASAMAGTGLMLWAALPSGSMPHPEWLFAVPLPPLLLGLGAWMAARRDGPPAFGLLRRQLSDDLQRLRDAAAPASSR